MLIILGIRGERIKIDPRNVDIIQADQKYLAIYTEGAMYLHAEAVHAVLSKYKETFVEAKRGLLVNKDFISKIVDSKKVTRRIIPKRNEPKYPTNLPISRRKMLALRDRIVELGLTDIEIK